VRRDLEGGTLAVVPTPVTPIARAWNLVRHSAHELSPAALQLVDYLSAAGFAARTRS
jgi:hypothetical protein